MWKGNGRPPVGEFLGWLFLIWIMCNAVFLLLEPYSIAVANGGPVTTGYVIYAVVGVFIATPNPMIATYITMRRHKQISSVKDFCRLVFSTPNKIKTILLLLPFCAAALCMAIIYGTPTGSPWYLMVAALPLMIIGGGVEEIGWRGFLQPSLERTFSFPIATIAVAVIWIAWHLPLWIQPSSNHYGDSLLGFSIMIFVWAFTSAAIYKATKSVFACVMHHAFINSIGAIYDWNALFDLFPNHVGMYAYFCITLIAAITIWVLANKKDQRAANLNQPV